MAVHITNEVHEGVYQGVPYREHERHVSGDRSSASVRDAGAYVTIAGIPDLFLEWNVIEDLFMVLDVALDLRNAGSENV